jgi:hypothetical protein
MQVIRTEIALSNLFIFRTSKELTAGAVVSTDGSARILIVRIARSRK